MGGINATFDFLAETPNETASDLLVELLDSKDREMREHALTAILKRRECLGQSMLMLRWQDWSDRWKALIAQYSHHMVEAIKQGCRISWPSFSRLTPRSLSLAPN